MSYFWLDIKRLKLVENALSTALAIRITWTLFEKLIDLILLLLPLLDTPSFLHLILFRVEVVLGENEVALCESPLHLLLHLVFQLHLLRSFTSLDTFAAGSIRLRLVHLVLDLCRTISTILVNDFLPLVESLLFELFQAAEIVILDVLLFVLRKYHIRQVGSIDVDRIGSILH